MLVELRDIHKTFGPVHANDNISLTIPSATIQGILGENGAGKSTLMKILSGFYSPDSGAILLDGKEVSIASPADAIRHGIGMLHQDPLDFPPISALDDFILGSPGGVLLGRNKAKKHFEGLASRFGFDLDPEAFVDSLTVGERQQLEILRLLSLGAQTLILDEPTTGISLPQKEKLFATLKKLSQEGMSVLFVSHKLEDVENLCDSAVVLRAGALVGSMKPPFDTKKLVELMFGQEPTIAARQRCQEGPSALCAKGLCLDDLRLKIRDVDLDVKEGEVIGLAGMEGSGQALFLEACAGLREPVGGSLCLDGDRNMRGKSYHAYKRLGVAYLPAARLEEGLVPGLSLTEHFILSEEQKGFFIDQKAARKTASERIELFNIKGEPESKVEALSGGNQQRALLALMRQNLKLILVEHPTRGLDIESTIYIWGKLKERCSKGTAIVFISSDLDEVLQYSDRVLVFFAGKVSPPLEAEGLTASQLGRLIGGKGWENFAAEAIHA